MTTIRERLEILDRERDEYLLDTFLDWYEWNHTSNDSREDTIAKFLAYLPGHIVAIETRVSTPAPD